MWRCSCAARPPPASPAWRCRWTAAGPRSSKPPRVILLDPLARPVIGHRGNRAFAPENTLESLLEAVALGADALEFDLRVSSDGQLVVFHDPTLERTTDGLG